MSLTDFIHDVKTPAFIYEEATILETTNYISKILKETNCKLLFPLKSFAVHDALKFLAGLISGFSCSSLYEAKLARDILSNDGPIHLTTPGLRPDEINFISELCDYISFNSISQWNAFKPEINNQVSCGLRINPKLSFIKDKRYDPCRKFSKLGVPIDSFCNAIKDQPFLSENLQGLHFHTNCESRDYEHLLATIQYIDSHLWFYLVKLEWINIGGGYLLGDSNNIALLMEAIYLLNNKYDLLVFFEPGKGIIGSAGYIASTVLDVFENDGQHIAILDTTVNHMPEVFEYQYKPSIIQENEDGENEFILAGSTCLAGDVFGKYRFDDHLEVGSKIVFEEMGAYTLVKANMFNGINLPTIYALTADGKLELKKNYTYEDFKSRCGV